MRQVVTRRKHDAVLFRRGTTPGQDLPCDTYRERLVKYVPVEILVFYIAVYGSTYAVIGTELFFPILARWLAIAGIICTPVYLWKAEQVSDGIQLLVSTAGFVVWVFALGVFPVVELPWYNQVVAAVFLPVYTLLCPFVEGIPESW